ncbi:hypothetical protein FRC14_008052 [Serendipita sp. 396]|nr:hypothetical protein FRC14_008052 [Serendipita sp. 396]KAG8776050.1 hypothetical protein FRC15_000169 [Serendipita sp. 397]KAG8800504.1 hypothetical protein FRC16_002771 [Serendipita sp. 398]KAG8818357.1 hypothetical protein FRC18_000134 [Serendipita sp. 400]KAG8823024.1 hypothetical protein FRC19_004797 [Serendipita sp. 401]KAG8847288.1 hypothetical protein FRB91_011902 [Serendipita sp. 411]KAG8859815.1 hypothetical protein FRC20_011784 [Serendipita sp. 405]KAG9027919.1 hypothetical prot
MSFFTGAVAGAVLAGGVYYSFSYRVRTGVLQYKSSLHELSERMNNPQSGLDIPPAASERIAPPPFSALVKQRWNEQVGSAFKGITEWRPSRP